MDRYSDIPYNRKKEKFNNDLENEFERMIDVIFDNFDKLIEEQVDMEVDHDNDNFKPALIDELKERLSIKID